MKFFKLIFLGVFISLTTCGQNSTVDKTQEILASLTEEPVITEGPGATTSAFIADVKILSNLMGNLQSFEGGEDISQDQQAILSVFSKAMSSNFTFLEESFQKVSQGEQVIINYELDGDSSTTEQAEITEETLSYLDELFQSYSSATTTQAMTSNLPSTIQAMSLFESSRFLNNLVTHDAASLKIWLNQAEAFIPGGMVTSGALCLAGNLVACSAFGVIAKVSESLMIGKTALTMFPTELTGISLEVESLGENKFKIRVVGNFYSSIDSGTLVGLAIGSVADNFVKTNLSDLLPTETSQSIFTEVFSENIVNSLDASGLVDTSQNLTVISNAQFTIDPSYFELRRGFFQDQYPMSVDSSDYTINDDGSVTLNMEDYLPGEFVWAEVTNWPTAVGETFLSDTIGTPAQDVTGSESSGDESGSGGSNGESGSDGGEGDDGIYYPEVDVVDRYLRFYSSIGAAILKIDGEIVIDSEAGCEKWVLLNLAVGTHTFEIEITGLETNAHGEVGCGCASSYSGGPGIYLHEDDAESYLNYVICHCSDTIGSSESHEDAYTSDDIYSSEQDIMQGIIDSTPECVVDLGS